MQRTPSASSLHRAAAASCVLALGLAGCGGGGGDSSGGSGTDLAFSVKWEQAARTSASVAVGTPANPPSAVFDTPIPPSVNTIRFLFRPASPGQPCCIAIPRDSQPFIDRHIRLADVTPGAGTLEVNGYAGDFAPSDGVADLCPTRPAGQGEACTSGSALPSFASGEVSVNVVANQSTSIDIDVHSQPFLLFLQPADESVIDDPTPLVSFTVVDAANNIAAGPSSPSVKITKGGLAETLQIVSSLPCRDGSATLPGCSPGEALGVRGLIMQAQGVQNIPVGTANLQIKASNVAVPPGTMDSKTTFDVEAPPPSSSSTTVTTAPSSTVPDSTTTTLIPTTTTTQAPTTTTSTLPPTTTTTELLPQTHCLQFKLGGESSLVGIKYTVDYSNAGGEFLGSGESVQCTGLVPDNSSVFNDNDDNLLSSAIISGTAFFTPAALAICEFSSLQTPVISDFVIVVGEATAPDLSNVEAIVIAEEIPCP